MQPIFRMPHHEVSRIEKIIEEMNVFVIHYAYGKLTGIVYRGTDEFPLRSFQPVSGRFTVS
jgi:hypothetical protein